MEMTKMTARRLTALALASMVLPGYALAAQVYEFEAEGVDLSTLGPSPYDVVSGWHVPFAEPGFAFGGNSGVFAESPDRIFVLQRGETRLPYPVPPEFAGYGRVHRDQCAPGHRAPCLAELHLHPERRWRGPGALDPVGPPLRGLGRPRSPPDPDQPLRPGEAGVGGARDLPPDLRLLQRRERTPHDARREGGWRGTTSRTSAAPQDVAFLPDGRILVADGLDNHRIIILDEHGRYISEFGGFGDGPGQFNGIHALGIGPDGLIFALDRSGGRVNVFRTTDDPAEVEFVRVWGGLTLTLDIIVGEDHIWLTDLRPLRFVKFDFEGNNLYTWVVPRDLPDGYLEVHTFSVDSDGNLYGGDNQYGRSQKFVPKPDADPALLIGTPWVDESAVR